MRKPTLNEKRFPWWD